ncbi:DUF2461 family protein [Pedobacter mucosus]|uniref:DUF2461 family protein n=1 Tax=Pedobacter mucosus TaxID=2895286 RepID=UPI001EE4CB2E|nr:DUF2461 family protein [Pedobacter mucosus]UKT65613.1 DUF2461 domain-containing protein [Pedobacter mucosus]
MEKTLKFLADLKANNHQAWFMDHIGEYERAKSEVWEFAYIILTQLSVIDAKLNPDIEVERFISNLINIRPKKEISYHGFFDIAINPLDNDGNEPAYFIHIEPDDQSYISIRYVPDVFGLQVMRNYISKNTALLDTILQDCYSAGFVLEESSMMPALPKGYLIGTPGENYIRLKAYELKSAVDLLKDRNELIQDILITFKAALPFLQFFREGLRL